jgi:rhomboid family GlyGly-CTERM serine protease
LTPFRAHAWLAVASVLALASIGAHWLPSAALDWQPDRLLEQPWRAWTAAAVHWTDRHLGANLVGCAAVAAFGVAARVSVRDSVAWLVAWPATQLALLVRPDLVRYAGASGVLHAGVAIAAWHLVRHGTGRRRAIGIGVIAGLAAKVLLEKPWGPAVIRVPEWDFMVAPLAHAAGAIVGLVAIIVTDAVVSPARDLEPTA